MNTNRPTHSQRAVFFDRDGTLIEEVGHLHRIEDIRIMPQAFEAVQKARKQGFLTVVVTNQSAVARGLLSEEQLREIHQFVGLRFQEREAPIDAFYYCPHHPEIGSHPYRTVCNCRKPATGMLQRASREWGIDLRQSYLVGDSLTDVEAGRRARCQTVLVRTGHGARESETAEVSPGPRETGDSRPDSRGPQYVADDVLDAVLWIKRRSTPQE